MSLCVCCCDEAWVVHNEPVFAFFQKVYLCDMNLEYYTSCQLRQSIQSLLDKRIFVRGIRKLGGNPSGLPTQRSGDLTHTDNEIRKNEKFDPKLNSFFDLLFRYH